MHSAILPAWVDSGLGLAGCSSCVDIFVNSLKWSPKPGEPDYKRHVKTRGQPYSTVVVAPRFPNPKPVALPAMPGCPACVAGTGNQ